MNIRKASLTDAKAVAKLSCLLWPDHSTEEMEEEFSALIANNDAAVFLAEGDGQAIGFAQCQLRHDYVEGCETSPVGFLEGVYVAAVYRRSGVARALLSACEEWARSVGCSEFASDCEIDNHDSLAWHLKNGFAEMGRTIWFAKKL